MRERKPDWQSVTDEALREPANLARVLAAMGFSEHSGIVTRGILATIWPPPYFRASRHIPRDTAAAMNRAIRDGAVHMLAHSQGCYAVCGRSGEWRNNSGAQRGDDLPSLGALMWGCRYGQAAFRIAQIIGLRIPRVA